PPAVLDGTRLAAGPHQTNSSESLNTQSQGCLVDHDARTHGRAQRDLLQVDALGRGRLRLVEVIDQREEVVLELVGLELRLADDAVDDSRLVDAVRNLA